MRDLFSEIEENSEIDETVREICENEDRFNSKAYFEKCKDAERKRLFEKKSKEKLWKSADVPNVKK